MNLINELIVSITLKFYTLFSAAAFTVSLGQMASLLCGVPRSTAILSYTVLVCMYTFILVCINTKKDKVDFMHT